MDQRRIVVVATAVGFLILAIILGTIFYLSKNLNKSTTPNKVVTSSPLPANSIPTASQIASPSPSAQATAGAASAAAPLVPGTKLYTGAGFSISYPQNWGLLTCSNSKNIEFDPYNSTDQLNFACNFAVKPITVVTSNVTSCSGDQVTLGANTVFKSRRFVGDGVDYKWCIKGNPGLVITHRVSDGGERATSKDDFSQQVEDMISHITFGTVGGGS